MKTARESALDQAYLDQSAGKFKKGHPPYPAGFVRRDAGPAEERGSAPDGPASTRPSPVHPRPILRQDRPNRHTHPLGCPQGGALGSRSSDFRTPVSPASP
jgi:hypothetical protein